MKDERVGKGGVVLPRIVLRPEAMRRVSRGHRWIFSNEVASRAPELGDGDEAAVFSAEGDFLGSALHSAHALIAARMYSRASVRFDEEYMKAALVQAMRFRERFHAESLSRRVVYGDADGLPGLIVDAFGRHVVFQILTSGMEKRRDTVIALLREFLLPESLTERSDTSARAYESMPERREVVFGTPPPRVEALFPSGVKLLVDVNVGQKTGLFLDQAENWTLAERHARGARVLDLFCHAGGWSMHALKGGAERVVAVDSSGIALADVRSAMDLNGFDNARLSTIQEDVFEFLRGGGEAFDLIVCDPPAFAKSKKSKDAAVRGYADINRLAMKRLAPGGVLVTCSCSHHVPREEFMEMLRIASRDAKRQFRVLSGGGPPADHAPLLSTPETDYLKVVVLAEQVDVGVAARKALE